MRPVSLADLKQRIDLPDKGQYLLGLSGGADSVALLKLLSGTESLCLGAVHVNHGIRGKESDEDENFVRLLCEKEDIPLYLYHPDLSGRTDENNARKARFACFRNAIEQSGAEAVILAHNRDDRAETFLLHLLRGSGPEGLSAMKTESRLGDLRILRPMLALSRDEIRTALQDAGIRWREDSTNFTTDYLRNRIRLELLPILEDFASGATHRISTAAELIGRDGETLDKQAEEMFNAVCADGRIRADKLADVPAAVACRVLRRWWNHYAPDRKERNLDFRQTELLRCLLNKREGKVNLPGGLYGIRYGNYMYLSGKEEKNNDVIPVNGHETTFGEWQFAVTPGGKSPGDGKRAQEVPDGFLQGCVIRTRREGDRIRPFRSGGTRKLQDYFTDRKIPVAWRDTIPLLCRENEVLLVCGVGAGDIPEWDRNRENIRLTWKGRIPWTDD